MRTLIKIFMLSISLSSLLLANIALGDNFFVRPETGEYGNEDGTSYDDAWDGFSDIEWSKGLP